MLTLTNVNYVGMLPIYVYYLLLVHISNSMQIFPDLRTEYLHLIFQISSLMNLIFFLVWTLIFAGNKHQVGKRQNIEYIKLNFSKIKCRSIVGKVWVAGCDELVYHFPLGISNHNKTDVKKFCHYNETGHNYIKV